MSTKKIGDTTPKKPRAPRAKKEPVIKPGEPAKIIDQETQVTPVQTLSDAQMDNTPIVPGTVVIDPSVDQHPVAEEPVKDLVSIPDGGEGQGPHPLDKNLPAEQFDTKAEKRFAKEGDKAAETSQETINAHDGSVLDQNTLNDAGEIVHKDPAGFDHKSEKELAGKEDTAEPTRYGSLKEVPADRIEEPGASRHNDSAVNPEFITGRKNEYPR